MDTRQGLLTYQEANNLKCRVSASHILIFSEETLNPLFMISCRGAWTVCCGATERPTSGFKVSKPPQIKLNTVTLRISERLCTLKKRMGYKWLWFYWLQKQETQPMHRNSSHSTMTSTPISHGPISISFSCKLLL